MNLDETFVRDFSLAALQAGSVAVYLQDQIALEEKQGHASPEESALTAVDLAAQDVILHLLERSFSGIPLDAEEETELIRRFPPAKGQKTLLVIDPVDGTLNYSRGSQDFAVMGALIQEGLYSASVVYFPAWQEIFWAIRGKGAWKRSGKDMMQIKSGADSETVLVPPHAWERVHKPLQDSGFKVVISRCSALDSMVAVSGRASASVALRPLDRRRGIGLLITAESGGSVYLGDKVWQGKDPAEYTGSSQLIVAAAEAHFARRILHCLQASGL